MNKLTNEQIRAILDGAPDGAFAIDHLIGSKEPCYLCIRDEGIVAVHIGQTIGFAPSDYPFSIRYQSLADLKEILTLSERVAELEEGRWISVDERLPEKCKHNDLSISVMVYNNQDKCFYSAYWDFISKDWFCFHSGQVIHFGVTHWMYMPQLPKENTNAK